MRNIMKWVESVLIEFSLEPALPHNSKEKTAHPTQKPLKLIERIIEMSTNEGDLVLDACIWVQEQLLLLV